MLPPTNEHSKLKIFLTRIHRSILASRRFLVVFIISTILFVVILSYSRSRHWLRCCVPDLICDMGELVGSKNCLGLVGRCTTTYGKLDYTLKEQWICHEQKIYMSHRCYLPHFINKQYEKYQAKQRGEEFYGDVKSCKDIEIQWDGEKK